MRFVVSLLVLIAVPLSMAASADNNIEWAGVSHVSWQDRRPLCPLDGESFEVRFQVYRFDITAARVRVDDGATNWIDAGYVEDRGPYAIWAAQVPATTADYLYYYIEFTDGSDTDYLGPDGMSDTAPAAGWELDFVAHNHAPLGSTGTSDGGAAFKVWAPTITSAQVKGGWNGWGTGTPMVKLGDYFVAHVPTAQPGTRDDPVANYKYVFNGSMWRSDPRARALHPGDNYNAVNTDRFNHEWQSTSYQTPAFEDLIIYQLHVGTFAGRNDPYGSTWNPSRYWDLMERVDHLAELGVTAVMLCPITEFAWDWSGGYNPASQFAVESAYGHPYEVKMMVDALHAAGIAVLFDVVWNHHGPGDDITWDYVGSQCYYDSTPPQTPWGPQMDFDRLEVREYYLHSMLLWLEEYRVDGFRFDGTDFMNTYQGSGWGLMQDANDWVDNRWVDKVMIAEQLPSDSWITRATSLGGAGFDAQYHMQFRDALRGAIFAAAGGNPSMWNVRNAIYSTDVGLSGAQRLNYIELHDEAWPESGGQRMVKTIDPSWPHDSVYAKGRTKLGQGLVLLSPGIPAILMGTEWLEDTDFGAGDWDNDPENRINWAMKDAYPGIFRYYQDVIGVRKSNGALRADAGYEVFHLNDSDNVIAFRRWDSSGNVVVVVANFNNSTFYNYQIGVPNEGTWYELVNSQAPGYEGGGGVNGGGVQTSWDDYDGFAQSVYITLPGMGFVVLRYNDPPNDFLDADGDYFNDVCDNCPNTYNPDQADYNGDGIGDACDCNDNGVRDDEDIAAGTSTDYNGNGIPDECDGLGDMNCDGTVNSYDIDGFICALSPSCDYEGQYPECDRNRADCNGDGTPNAYDIDLFIALVGG
ncbi:MAG: alpha amylase C-terminal domain-containing protein [Planctomycetota bacterium]